MSRVHVRFLGSGDAFGSGGRFQTSILVDSGGFRCLLDCGATTLVALKRAAIDPASIGAILVSHLHGDHFGGIPFFVLDAQFARRENPLVIAGPPGLRERLARAMEVLFPGSSTVTRRFDTEIVEMPAGAPTSIGPIEVTPFEVLHACGAPPYALRLSVSRRVVAYSGDTEWTESLIEASKGSDLFICEAYFYDKRVPHHLDYQTLLAHRGQISTKRLVLTHMSHDMLERLATLDVEAAADDSKIDL